MANREAETASQEVGPDYNLQTTTSTLVAYFFQQGSTPPGLVSPAGESHPNLSCGGTCQKQVITEIFPGV